MEQTVFRLTNDVGKLKKGDHVTIFFVKNCCDYRIIVKKKDEEVYQAVREEDLKKVKGQ